MFRLFRSWLVWLTIGVLTLTGTVFWVVVVPVAAIMSTAVGGIEPDPDDVARVAVPLGLLTVAAGLVIGIAAVVMVRRGKAREWVPMREQMVRDSTKLPGIYLAQVVGQPGCRWAGSCQGPDHRASGSPVASGMEPAAWGGGVFHRHVERRSGSGMDDRPAVAGNFARGRTDRTARRTGVRPRGA